MSMASKYGGREAARFTALVLAYYGTVCHLCGEPGADTGDHVIPRSRGGDNSVDNGRPAHHGCNSARGDMPLAEWFAKRRPRVRACTPSRVW